MTKRAVLYAWVSSDDRGKQGHRRKGIMKPPPRAVYHYGTCLQCGGEGDVLTIADNPIDLSLCGDCLAFLIRDAAGMSAGRMWTMHGAGYPRSDTR
jgi:hypothetical protein